MPFAFTLRLDPVCAASVEDMWRTLAADRIDADCYRLGYAPHITLAIYPDEVSSQLLAGVFEQVTAYWQALPITLCGFGVFPGATSILWLAPVVTRDLLARNAAVCEALPTLPVHPHYRPASWMPHITLSGAVRHPERALAALLPLWRPIDGYLDQADLVRFRPVEVLRSRVLPRS